MLQEQETLSFIRENLEKSDQLTKGMVKGSVPGMTSFIRFRESVRGNFPFSILLNSRQNRTKPPMNRDRVL